MIRVMSLHLVPWLFGSATTGEVSQGLALIRMGSHYLAVWTCGFPTTGKMLYVLTIICARL